jgi:hypothetical protein
VVAFFIIVDCSKQPNYKVNEAIAKSEDSMSKFDNVDTTVSAVNGKKIKFRIMVNEQPTVEEATELFNKVLNDIEKYLAQSRLWDYYEGYFDIKTYESGVIYKATKHIDNDGSGDFSSYIIISVYRRRL